MFINTYIWKKLLTVRLFWAGPGLASGLQRRVAGATIGAGMCSACGCDSGPPSRLSEVVCAVENRVTQWFSPPIINQEKGRDQYRAC